MRIEILNRDNLIEEVDEGAILNLCKNETLDSAVIRVSNLEYELKIEPFDTVLLSDFQLSDRKMLVDTVTKTITCLNPLIYSYEIHLFSLTKDLENYLLPNKKITRVWDEPRSVKYYLEEYLAEYGPKIRVDDGNDSYVWTSKYVFSSRLRAKFGNIICPEMQWNQPTLREVFNDLLMTADCIVNINQNYEIDYLDLTELNNDITNNESINYITSSQSSEDYVSELKMNLVNITNPIDNSINNRVTKTEWCHIEADEDLITSDNWFVRTQYPIYNIKSLKMFFYCNFYNAGSTMVSKRAWISVDLMNADLMTWVTNLQNHGTLAEHVNLVYEYKEWQTKKQRFQRFIVGQEDPVAVYPEYKNYTLYYVRGDNKIQNFTNQALTYVGGTSVQLITLLQNKVANSYGVKEELPIVVPVSVTNGGHPTTFFAIEYETLEGCLFKASKRDYPRHHREIMDNQTNSYIESYNQGFLEYMKANRLGNLQLQINAREIDEYSITDCHVEEVESFYIDEYGNVSGEIAFTSDETFNSIPSIKSLEVTFYLEDSNKNETTDYINCEIQESTLWLDNGYLKGKANVRFSVASSWDLQSLSIVPNDGAQLTYLLEHTFISLGDYYNDSIIYQIQYQIYASHVEINALATKDYVLRNYFTGVKSKIRSWKVVDGSEALKRHDLIKYYVEFSFNSHYEKGIDDVNDVEKHLSVFESSSNINPIRYAAVRTDASNLGIKTIANGYMSQGTITAQGDGYDSIFELAVPGLDTYKNVVVTVGNQVSYSITDDVITFTATAQDERDFDTENYHFLVTHQSQTSYPESTDWYILEVSSRMVGNSLIFTFGFNDNYYAGIMFDPETINFEEIASITQIPEVNGGYPQKFLRYVNDDGENSGETFKLLSGVLNNNGYGEIVENENISPTNSTNIHFVVSSLQKPIINNAATLAFEQYIGTVTYHKDSQEISYVSVQFEYCTDTNDITFTKEFIRRQEFIRTVSNVHTLSIKSSTEYDFRNIFLPSGAVTELELQLVVIANAVRIRAAQVNGTADDAKATIENLIKGKALYIVDENNVLLLAIDCRTREIEYGAQRTLFGYIGYLDIYLNTLYDRNKDIYDSQENQLFIKSI